MFWENYLLLCGSVGKSPNAVASEIGVKSSGTVTGWSNGAIPRKSVIFKLCRYFDVTEDQLFSDNFIMNPVPPDQSTRGMTPEEREAHYLGLSLAEQKQKPADQVADGLTEEEMEYLRWYREEASERDKALIRMIVKGDS